MISGEYKTLSQFERRAARFRSYLLGRTAICGALTLGIAAGIAPRVAKAGPQGSVVVGGAVDMQQAGTHTEFTQHTQTAILNHNSFDINVNESVNFAQPNASSLAVNRVVGSDLATNIAGKLTANGNVWVLNPSGVAVQGTAQVNVGGLVATTAGISDEAIMAGQRTFAGAPDGSAVTNAGSITAGDGSVVLVAPVVRNSGSITAQGSDVALGAGSGFTVDFDGDGLTRFEVTPGNGVSLSNTGTISAQGGAAYLSAASAEAVQTAVVSIGGKVEATRIEEKGGVIVISGGDKGITEVSGEIDASQAAGDGGRVIVTGDLIDVQGTAQIDTSGTEDGGTIEIGGAFQGGAIQSDVVVSAGAPATTPLPTARRTAVRRGATIVADAGAQGDGGEVIVWADEATGFRGEIAARGGAEGGDGGFAEVSGKQNLLFDGRVDLSAPGGATGTLLLDPANVSIVAGAAADDLADDDAELDDDTPADGTNDIGLLEGAVGTFTISAGAIQDSVDSANTIIEALDAITQSGAVDLTGLAANSLTYRTTTGDITFDAQLTGNAGAFTAEAGGNINLNANITSPGAVTLTAGPLGGTVDFSGGGLLSGGAVTLSAGGALQLGGISATTLDVTAAGAITDTAGQAIFVSGGTTMTAQNGGNFFDIQLDNEFGVLGTHDFSGAFANEFTGEDITVFSTAISGFLIGDVTANSGGSADPTIAGNSGDVRLIAGFSDLEIAGTVTVPGDFEAAAGLDLFDSTGHVDVDGLTSLSARDIVLDSTSNDFDGIVDAAASFDNVILVDTNRIVLRDVRAVDAVSITATEIDTEAGVDLNFPGVRSSNTTVTFINGSGDATQVGGTESGGANSFVISDTDISRVTARGIVVDANGGDATLDSIDTTNDSDTAKDLTIAADDVDIDDTVNLGSSTLAFVNTSATEMNFGATPGGEWGLSDDQLGDITAGAVTATTGGQDFRLTDVTQLDEDLTITAGLGIVRHVGTNTGLGDFTVASAGQFGQAAGGDSLDVGTNAVGITASGNIAIQDLTAGSLTLNAGDDVSIFGTNTVSGAALVDAGSDDIVMFGTLGPAGATDIQFSGGASLAAATLELRTAGGNITANAGTLSSGTTSLTASGAGDVTVLGLAADGGDAIDNDLVISADTGDVFFNDAATTPDNLTVASSASVNQNAGGALIVPGQASFTSAGSIDLGAAVNNFSTTTVDASGTDITLNDVDEIGLGTVTATGNLTVTAGGAITDTVGEAIKVTGSTSLSASGDITLANGLHDFDENITGDALTFTGANVTLSDVDRLTLGASTATGTTLDLTAEDFNLVGTVTVGGGTGAATLTTSSILLSDSLFAALVDGDGTNFGLDFTSTDAANLATGTTTFSDDGTLGPGGNVVIADFDSGTSIGDVVIRTTQDIDVGSAAVADTTATFRSDLTLETGNDQSIETVNGGALVVLGALNFDAGAGAVTLTDADNDFQGAVNGTGGSASLTDTDAIVLGDLDIATNLTVTARGTITNDGDGAAAGDDIDVGGLASFTADDVGTKHDIVLDDAFNDFSAATVDANGNNITLNDVDEIGLGAITAAGNLTVTAGGTITDTAGRKIDVTGTTSLLAEASGDFFDIQLDNDGAADVHSFGGAVTASGEDIHIHDIGAIALETLTPHDDSLGTVDTTIDDGNEGDLTVRAGASITNTGALNIPGDLSLTAQSFTDETNFFDIFVGFLAPVTVGGALSASGEDIEILNSSGTALEIGTIIARGPATDGTRDLAAPDFDDGSLFIRSNGANDGTGGSITVDGKLIVDGAGDFVFDNDGAHAIPQLEALAFGPLGVATNITLDNETALVLGNTFSKFTTSGDLTIDAEGSVTQQAGGISVGGLAVTAQNDAGDDFFDIALTDAANAITGTVAATGEDISITNAAAGGTTLGDIDANGDANDDTTIDNGNDGDLTVVSTAGAIFDDGDGVAAGDDIDVGGLASFTAADAGVDQDIELNDAFNDFSAVDANGDDITLNDIDEIALGAITAAGNLTVLAGGSITDTAGEKIDVAGRTSLVAESGGAFFDIALDNADLHDFDSDAAGDAVQEVDATGGDIQLDDANAIALGAIDANVNADTTLATDTGELTVLAGGSITDTAGEKIDVAGRTSLAAEGGGDFFDIALDNADLHDFDSDAAGDAAQEVDATGGDIHLDDANAIALGAIDANVNADATLATDTGELTVLAGGSITDTAGEKIDVAGRTSLAAEGGGAFFDIALDNADLHDFDSDAVGDAAQEVDATGGDIHLDDANAIALGAIDANVNADTTLATDTGELTVLAGGSITDTAGEKIDVAGRTSLAAESGGAFFDIALDNADLHDFDSDAAGDAAQEVDATGGDIHVDDANAIALGAIDANVNADATLATDTGELTVLAGGSITDTAGEKIDVAGRTSLVAESGGAFFDIALDNADLHDFDSDAAGDAAQEVDATGGDIHLDDANAIALGAIDANVNADATLATNTGELTVLAGGSITDTAGEKIDVAGRTSLVAEHGGAFFDIALDNADLHDFDSDAAGDAVQEVDATGGDIQLDDANAIALGAIDANVNADATLATDTGELTVLAGGSITDTAGEKIDVAGRTSLAAESGGAFFDIALDNADLHDFDSDAVGDAAQEVDATGGDIHLDDANAIALGAIDANVNADTTLATDTGELTVLAGGSITDTAGEKIDVAGRTSLAAESGGAFFDIALDNADLHDFDSDAVGDAAQEVDATGGDIHLDDANAIALGAIDANVNADATLATDTGELTVLAGGSITDTAGEKIDVAGRTSLVAESGGAFFDIALDNADLHDFDSDAAGDAAQEVDATGGDIHLDDANAIALGAIDANVNADATLATNTGELTVLAGGSITDTAGEKIDVAGRTSLAAEHGGAFFDIALDNADLHDFDSDAVGDAAQEVDATGGDIHVDDANAIALGAIDANVNADATLATDTGELTVLAGGSITDTAGEKIDVAGRISLVAESGGAFFDIALDNADLHDFDSDAAGDAAQEVDATGGDIHLDDANAIALGAIDANVNADTTLATDTGELTVLAGGSITDTAGEKIDVAGRTSLAAEGGGDFFDIALDNADLHDFDSDAAGDAAQEVDATGGDIHLDDANAIALGAIDANVNADTTLATDTGELTVLAGGSITDTAGEKIDVAGRTSLAAEHGGAFFDIALDNADLHDFDSDAVGDAAQEVDATGGDIHVDDANAIALGAIDANVNADTTLATDTGELTVLAGGSITDTAGEKIDVAGRTSLAAESGGAFFDIALDNADLHDFDSDAVGDAAQEVDATGGDIHLDDANAIALGAIDANVNADATLATDTGELTVLAGGSITDTAGEKIDVAGRTSLAAEGGGDFFDIALDNADLHDFDSDAAGDAAQEVDATGGDIHLDDANAIALGAIDANVNADATLATDTGELTVLAGGSITDTAGEKIDVAGRTSLAAESGGAFFDIALDNADLHDFDSDAAGDAAQEVDATGGDIHVDDANAIALGAIDANVNADATLATDTGELTVLAGGSITDTAGEKIDVAGRTSLAAEGGGDFFDIALDNADLHDFDSDAAGDAAQEVDATGGDIHLDDANAIALGAIDANVNADATLATDTGELTVLAGGSITDTAGEKIDVAGRTSLAAESGGAFFDIALDNADLHDFDSDAVGDAAQEVDATGGDIHVDDANAIALGAIDANVNADATLATDTGELTVLAGGSITDTAGEKIDVAGRTSLVAESGGAFFDIALDNADLHDFDSDAAGDAAQEVDATGGDIHLDDANAIALGAIDANVNADATLATNTGELTVLAGGSITDTAGEKIDVAGRTSLVAEHGGAFFDIALDNADLHDFDSDAAGDAVQEVDATGGDIQLDDANAIALGAIDANVNADATLATDTGELTVLAGGSITDTAGEKIDVAGRTSLAAESGGAFFDIALDNADLHDFDSDAVGDAAQEVDATGGDIHLDDANAIALGAIDANVNADTTLATDTGELTVLAGGSITDTAGEKIDVAGRTSLAAEGGGDFFDIALDNADLHDFDSDAAGDAAQEVDATGGDIHLDDANAIALGAIDANVNADATLATDTGELTVLAGGSITDTAGEKIDVAGRTSLAAEHGGAFFDIALDNADLHDFDSDAVGDAAQEVDATGGDIHVDDANAIALGAIDANVNADTTLATDTGELTVLAGGSITDTAGEKIDVAGRTSLAAEHGGAFFDIALDNADLHDFDSDAVGDAAQEVDATGGDIHVDDANAIALGAIDANVNADTTLATDTGELTVLAGGSITDTAGEKIDVAGRTSLAAESGGAFFDIALDNADLHDFDSDAAGDAAQEVDATGGDIHLDDANAIALGAIDANVNADATLATDTGELTVLAGGSITDTAGEKIDVAGRTSLAAEHGGAFFDIALDNADLHDFDSDAAGDAAQEVDATGGDIQLDDANAIALGAIDANVNADATLATDTGELTVLAGGSITDTAGEKIDVAGRTSLAAESGGAFFDIALDNADLHDFDSDAVGDAAQEVDATGGDIQLDDANAIALGAIDANVNADATLATDTGELTVLAGGSITDTAGEKIDVAGRTSLVAESGGAFFDIALDNADLHDFDSDAAGDAAQEVDATGGDIHLDDANAIALGAIDANVNADATLATDTGELTVLAGGSITDTAGEKIDVAGRTSLAAESGGAFFDIALDNADLHDFDSDAAGDAVQEVDATGGDIQLDDANAIALGAIDANVNADATLATDTGELTVLAGGSITDTAGEKIDVAGRTSLAAESGGAFFDIALDNADLHDFDSDAVGDAAQEVDATGGDIHVDDANAIALGAIDANVNADTTLATDTGELTVLAGGSITDTAGEKIDVAGRTSLAAEGGGDFFDIALDNADLHDFDSDAAGDAAQEVDATGGDIHLDDANAIALGAIDANVNADATLATDTGELTVLAGGSITDTAGEKIDVAGRTSLAAEHGGAFFDIALDNADLHDFDSDAVGDAAQEVDATGGDIHVDDANAIALGAIDANVNADTTLATDTGELTVLAGGSITDTAGEKIDVAGRTSLAAESGGAFFDIALDNADLHDFDSDAVGDAAQEVDATGGDIHLDDANAIALGAIDANVNADTTLATDTGELTVLAGGSITDTAGEKIDVAGRTSLAAEGGGDFFDIALDNADLHDFDSDAAGDAVQEVDATGGDIHLDDANAIALGAIDANVNADTTLATDTGELTVLAGGSITDTAGEKIDVAGRTSLAAESGGAFFDIALDNADLHDFTGAVSAAGEDIVLDDANAIVLGAIDANEGGAAADPTIGLFDDNGDGLPGAGDLASKGDLTVRAGGSITDTAGEKIDVAGRTRLEARTADASTVFDIVLDTALHDFDSNAALSGGSAGDASDEVDAVGRDVTLVDAGAIALGKVAASGNLTVLAGGSITDTDSLGDLEAVTVGGTTSLLAGSTANFFDIALDNADTHDFTGAVDLTGEGIVIFDTADLTIASIQATSDGEADPTVTDTGHGHGRIDLTVTSGDFVFDPEVDADGNAVPLQADGDISLTAPVGSFGVLSGTGITRRQLQDGLTFRSTSGNILLEFGNGFVVPDVIGRGPFTLDAAAGTSTLIIGNPADPDRDEFLGIGTPDFLADAQLAGFNPLFVTTDIGDAEIFRVTGNFALTAINRNTLTVRFQNSSEVPNQGDGTTVLGTTGLIGDFAGLSMFGTFNGASRSIASLQGFVDAGGFVVENGNTVNGCVIGLPSSCQPIGSLTLALDFPDGLLLGVRFINPDEDLDDPFTNRGDEEEWE